MSGIPIFIGTWDQIGKSWGVGETDYPKMVGYANFEDDVWCLQSLNLWGLLLRQSMDVRIISALIALIGVALSALVASVTSRRTVSVEIRKLRVDLQQAYMTKVIESRITTYPQLYSYLSDLFKVARRQIPSLTDLEKLRDDVESWDSQHAIFLGRETTNICYVFRMELHRIVDEWQQNPESADPNHRWLRDLLDSAEKLELALRSDLGIYGIQGAPSEDEPVLQTEYIK